MAHEGLERVFRPLRWLAWSLMATSPTRQRSLFPVRPGGAIEGWMDDDVASAASQLFGSGPRGLLVIDARELLTSTARVVGAQLGELHFKVWMGLITLHAVHGMPEDGRGSSGFGEFGRLVWGSEKACGGTQIRQLLRALIDLRQVVFTVPGYDLVNGRPMAAVSDTNLFALGGGVLFVGVDGVLPARVLVRAHWPRRSARRGFLTVPPAPAAAAARFLRSTSTAWASSSTCWRVVLRPRPRRPDDPDGP